MRRLYTVLVGALALACLAMAVLSGAHAMIGAMHRAQTTGAAPQAAANGRSGTRAAHLNTRQSKAAAASSTSSPS